MAAPLLKTAPSVSPEPPLLTLIRVSALECRVAARASATACATIDPKARADVFATQLVKMLSQFLKCRPVVWRPGTQGVSFDEAWILAVVQAVERRDDDSERFLLASRVKPASIHNARLLLRGLARSANRSFHHPHPDPMVG